MTPLRFSYLECQGQSYSLPAEKNKTSECNTRKTSQKTQQHWFTSLPIRGDVQYVSFFFFFLSIPPPNPAAAAAHAPYVRPPPPPPRSWLALLSALVSNLTNALRNVLIVRNIGPAAAGNRRKASPSSALGAAIRNHPMASAWNGGAAALVNTRAGSAKAPESGLTNLAPGDTYRLLTVVGAILLFPAAAYFERGSWPRLWQGATDATAALLGRGAPGLAESSAAAAGEGVGGGVSTLAEAAAAASRGDWAEAFQRAIVSGLCFNLFYDLTFRLLGQLHPVTHAVGNTVKRIVVIAAGAFAFGGDLGGTRSALGSALAVAGVLGYSVAKARCKPITTTRRSA